jgi:hypothetical protein
VVAELRDVERMIRREPPPANESVVVDAFPPTGPEQLAGFTLAIQPYVREDVTPMGVTPFTLATGLTRGEARDLVEQLADQKVTARVVAPEAAPEHPLYAPG